MAIVNIHDNSDSQTALAELLYSHLDQNIDTATIDDYPIIGHLWGLLTSNPILFNCLSQEEVDGLSRRMEELHNRLPGSDHPDRFLFDY